jgi:hypothetical protein
MKIRISEKNWDIIRKVLNHSFYSSQSRCCERGMIGIIKKVSDTVLLVRTLLNPIVAET